MRVIVKFIGWCSGIVLLHSAHAQTAAARYEPADVRYGAAIYASQCASCHGVSGDSISKVDFRSGKFQRVSSDADLRGVIRAGIRGTAMPPFRFNEAELSGIVAYVRNMDAVKTVSVNVGDAARGRQLFDGAGGCTACHRVNGNGSRIAPDLSEIGAVRTAARLERALVDPTASMLPMNRSVRAVTRDGREISGRRLNEDTYSVQLIDKDERLRSISKADLREYQVLKTSPMPSYQDRLDPQQIADVVSYLLTLRGIN
jgi:putative heme-binding domain-containing protein